jgi:hypothetical protein
MHVDHDRVGVALSGQADSSRSIAANGSSSGSMKMRPIDVDHQHARAVARLEHGGAAPGRAGGKLIGRSSCGARSMKTSASFWSQE